MLLNPELQLKTRHRYEQRSQPLQEMLEGIKLPLIPQTGMLVVGETVNIIQHPNGEPRQLAIQDNKVIDELGLFLHYQTDTSLGSSGSPVFNDQWEMVALHHSGVPGLSQEGKIRSTDGRDWEEWMGEQRIAGIANEGVRVSRLVQHVQAQNLSEPQRQLVDEILAAKPPELPSPPAEQPPSPPAAVAVTQQVEATGQGAAFDIGAHTDARQPLAVLPVWRTVRLALLHLRAAVYGAR